MSEKQGIDPLRKYEVTLASGAVEYVYAGNIQFTVSGDALFEDENRNFLTVFGRAYWTRVSEVRPSN